MVKRRLGAVAGIMVMVLALVGATTVSAMTRAEAEAACDSLPSFASPLSNSNTLKCIMDTPASSQCKNVGGTFTGKDSTYDGYDCLIPFTSTTTTVDVDDEIDAARAKCEAKGGIFQVTNRNATSFTSSCSADTPDNTTLPEKDTGGTNGDSDNSESSGVQWTTNNSGARTDNGCNGGVSVNILGDTCLYDDGNGSIVFSVLNVILQILTWGVGIAGTIGIVITGITYMTARDDVAQMTKAKNRLIQIIIGLAVYAVMWALLQWLLPGGVFGN